MEALQYSETRKLVLDEINRALAAINPEDAARLIREICQAEKVFFVGVGRVKMSLEAFAKRLYHLGINANVVGDTTEPAISAKDILIVGSGSGESIVPVVIAKKAKEIGARVIHIGSNPKGSISQYTDFMVRIPVRTRLYLEDEIESQQIMTSLFEQTLLIFGDILAKMMVAERNIDLKSLWEFHANLE